MAHDSTLETSVPGMRGAIMTSWACRLVTAVILAQTLFFKFTYAPETRVIFSRLGGRPAATLVGLAELACVVLLLLPGTAVLGALLSLAVIAGALGTHLFVIGIQVVDPATGRGDGGLLFGLALAVALLSLAILVLQRKQLAALLRQTFVRLRPFLPAVLAAVAFTLPVLAVEPINKDRSGLALEGYDVVAYFTDGQPLPGKAELTHKWNGAVWRFASPEHRDLFAAAPEKYAPQYGGYCAKAVSENDTAGIDPRAFKIVDGKLYLNYSAKIQKLWEQDIPGRIAAADKNWPGLLKQD